MEKGLNSFILEQFKIEQLDVNTYSPLTLAYIGDAIYDLVIRSVIVGKGNTKPVQLHRATSRLVKAHAQSEMMHTLEPLLTEKEADIFRRGRNAKSATMAKNASMSDYRRATGFEALMGYLYLTDQTERMMSLITQAVEVYDEEEHP